MKGALREVIETIALTAIVFLLVHSLVQNFKVEGSSMEPTLHTGQYLLVNKAAYLKIDTDLLNFIPAISKISLPKWFNFEPFGSPKPGDVVVFRYPQDPQKDFIKRVIAGPGDTVQVKSGQIWVNGRIIDEPYLQDHPSYTVALQTVPPNNYFVLGDNRNNSSDSHVWGLVPRENIVGKAWVIYWPFRNMGLVFNYALAVGP
ncbi:MAG: signal peptidase I [Dehalococcoidia bacterium]|nr:signal peptidase I [Dehalococcoidia bacterium]